MRNHFQNISERTHDYENLLPTYGNTSCSYDTRDGGPKDESRACYERDACNISPAPQLGTGDGSRGDTVYLTVRRRHPSGKSSMRSSVQGISRDEDFWRENMNVGWERCTVFDEEGSSRLAPEREYAGDEQSVAGRNRIMKSEGNNQVIDEYTLKQLSNSRNSPRVERRSPLSSMDDRKFFGGSTVGGSVSGSQSDLKEVTTQNKRRISINTSNNRPCLDVNSERVKCSHASPNRSWLSKTQPKKNQQNHRSPCTYSSAVRRSTSSRNVVADKDTSCWSPSGATPKDALTDGHRKPCDDGSTEERQRQNPLRNLKDNSNDRMLLSRFLNCRA